MSESDSIAGAAVDGRLWVEKDGVGFLGKGRVQLLEQIAERGSISAAARAMGMSYKAAWDSVDAMNNLSDEPLLVRVTGGRNGGGTRLTEQGRRVVHLYRVIEDEYRRFLGGLSAGISEFDRFYELMRRFSLKTSARNQFRGEVEVLKVGTVSAEVVVALPGGDRLVSIISREAAESLALSVGAPVHAMCQESAVMICAEDPSHVTARNRLAGEVVRCHEGAVNGEVVIQLPGGHAVTSIITNASIERLGLREGVRVWGLVKATDVVLAVSD